MFPELAALEALALLVFKAVLSFTSASQEHHKEA